MPEPLAQLTRSEKPNPLGELLDQYRHTPLIAAGDARFVGRIVIEVFEGASDSLENVEIASTWWLPPDRDAGLIFQGVAARLNQIGGRISGSRPAGAVTLAQ
jgi:hypothetical protein